MFALTFFCCLTALALYGYLRLNYIYKMGVLSSKDILLEYVHKKHDFKHPYTVVCSTLLLITLFLLVNSIDKDIGYTKVLVAVAHTLFAFELYLYATLAVKVGNKYSGLYMPLSLFLCATISAHTPFNLLIAGAIGATILMSVDKNDDWLDKTTRYLFEKDKE